MEQWLFKRLIIRNGETPPLFSQKQNVKAILLSNFINNNKIIRKKLCPILKIQEMLLKIESFTHASIVRVKLGYYRI